LICIDFFHAPQARSFLPEAFSHDQAVKTLLKTYPAEALEFLAPDVSAAHGPPLDISFLDPAVTRDDTAESGPGMAMDLVIRYGFNDARLAPGSGGALVGRHQARSASHRALLRGLVPPLPDGCHPADRLGG
jgi:hypothetical protein